MLGSSRKPSPLQKNGASSPGKKSTDPLKNLGVHDDEDVRRMQQGAAMLKVRSPRWQRRRMMKLLDDGLTVWCESNKTSSRAKSRQSFTVTDVECVLEGCQTETLRKLGKKVREDEFLTIVFKGPRKSLDLHCPSPQEARSWARGIRTLQERMDNMTHTEKLDHWINAYLKQADENHDGKMSYEEVQTLLQMINIDLNEQYARNLFQKCDRSQNGRLEQNEIELFCRELLRRPELDAVFQQYSANGTVLSTVDLRDFLRDQGEDASLVHAQSLILTYELNEWAQKNQYMTPNGFTMYMISKENVVLEPEHGRVYQDMRQPLAHYYINSSHNTYLTRDQLMSDSSTEPYIRALSRGCRCVELDCWDGDQGEPIIYHGHTLTSKITFREVVHTINQYAFKASPYPLILSLENHCSVEQQAVMARILRSVLGDKLLTKSLSDKELQSLPTPEELKGKILVKGKKECKEEESSSSSDSSSEDESKSESKAKPKKCTCVSPQPLSKLSPELSDLVVYTRSVPFKGFLERPLKPPHEMSSFSESEALKYAKDSGMLFVRHNTRQLSRIYPSGQRVQSSNYNPQDMWNAGCQIVALNFQTPGESMDLNQGRFLSNGGCGYVLKPSFLRQADSEFNPENTGGGPGHSPILLTIRVISAQQLPKSPLDKPEDIVDPYVWVETHGAPIDNNKKKTHRIDNNGFNPRWDCTFKFQLHVPELVLVRFVVEDHDYTSSNDFLGQYTLPLTSMRTGYRHVRLLKEDGASLSPSTLFIHVKVTPSHGTPTKKMSPQKA